MTQGILAALAAAALLVAAPSIAQDVEVEVERREVAAADAERQLADAQRRLEEAAREVAELSMQAHGPLVQEIRRIRLDAPGRAMLGINIDNAAPGVNGVRVVSVSPGGPAEKAGVKAGDLVVALGGKPLASGRELMARMREVEPGDSVELLLKRGDGAERKVSVVAKPREELAFIGRHGGPGEAMEFELDGIPPFGHFLAGPFGELELAPMSPGLGRYFGTEKGLLVLHAPQSAGDALEDGDVILAIGGREPQDPGHAMRILGSYQPGETVDIKVLRRRAERTVKLQVPAAPRIERRIMRVAPPAPPAPPAPGAPPAPKAPPAPPAG